MKKSALSFLLLTGLFKAVLCALFGSNIYIPIQMNWGEARKYCREHHTDLSSVNSQEEDEKLFEIGGPQRHFDAWIGLYKDVNDSWKWSGGNTASHINWSTLHDTSDNSNKCVVQNKRGWYVRDCEMDKYRFYCFESNMFLVKENKTWEEAMEQCRKLGGDLVSLPAESALTKILQTSREAQADYVWTGLRYLAGSWVWVNGDNMEYQAWSKGRTPQCPNRSRKCGVLSLVGQHWDTQDCVHKFNFVCNKNNPES